MINIVLYEPEIPGNTGNIMRTCAATYAKLHLIEPLGFKLDSANVKRSGVNYIDKVDYVVYEDWNDFINKNNGDFYFLTRYGKQSYASFDFSDKEKNIYLIFGKESTGIPKEILKNYLNRCLRVPASDNVRSLNLSNTVAIMLYEVLRQQNFPGLSMIEPHKGEDWLEVD